MSKETEPIRSRRQMREQSAQANGTAGVPTVPVKAAPKAPESAAASQATVDAAPAGAARADAAPVAAAPAGSATKVPAAPVTAPRSESAAPRGERQSQTRARDRAALRAYKELIDPPGLSPLPSRRALRQAQLDAERAPVTAVNPVVSVTAPGLPPKGPQTQQSPHVNEPASEQATDADIQSETDVQSGTAVQSGSDLQSGTAGQDAALPEEGSAPPAPPAKLVESGQPVPTALPTQPAPPVEQPKGMPTTAPPRNRAGRRAAVAAPAKSGASSGAPSKQQGPKHPSAMDQLPLTSPADSPADQTSGTADAATEAPATGNGETAAADAGQASSKYAPLPGLVPGGSYYPVTAGPRAATPAAVPTSTGSISAVPPATVPPTTEELRVLAAERADAERAAILSERAQARERLAQESAKNRRQPADPTATNNLAMVTPLEFVEVPGAERPVMRPPTTTHIPVVTRSTPRQGAARRTPPKPPPAPARTAAQTADEQLPDEQSGTAAASAETAAAQPHAKPQEAVPNVSAERFDAALAARAGHRPGPGNRPLTGGRSSTLKRAEAMATGGQRTVPPAVGPADVQRSQMPPIPADYAHGLEPLDAVTAGLGRTKRNMLIQWGSVVAGGAALVVGVIMFITALAR
ncbi:hypothetical protein ACT3TS_05845 [Specibacter sp. AOP5-B1-6]|uniref:hypothetical protein n=1 Tax=Specibacter sp. AOP5-B1-6 TaxID=3457653 RepID=UPI00402BA135